MGAFRNAPLTSTFEIRHPRIAASLAAIKMVPGSAWAVHGIIFFSMPAMFLRDDQVVVDLFQFVRRGWFGWVMTIIISILTVGATWIVAGRVGKYALRALEDGDETIYLKIPVYLTVMLITALLYLSCVFAAIRGLRALLRPGKTLPDETGGQPIGD